MVLRTRQIILALLAPLLLLFVAAPAMAQGTGYGTPAWSTSPLTLFAGPGRQYDVIGAIPDDAAVTVYRCTVLWCKVEQGHNAGWATITKLNFGQSSANFGARLNYGQGGPGEVCFYEGRNYTGGAICLRSGSVFNDLALSHLDNRFSSVSVTGNVSAAVCRDRDFQSYCERVIASQKVLDKFLDDNVSAIRVY